MFFAQAETTLPKRCIHARKTSRTISFRMVPPQKAHVLPITPCVAQSVTHHCRPTEHYSAKNSGLLIPDTPWDWHISYIGVVEVGVNVGTIHGAPITSAPVLSISYPVLSTFLSLVVHELLDVSETHLTVQRRKRSSSVSSSEQHSKTW